MQILLHKDGQPIGNLHGAGGVITNGYMSLATIGLGTHVNASLLFGAYAGNCVCEALQSEAAELERILGSSVDQITLSLAE